MSDQLGAVVALVLLLVQEAGQGPVRVGPLALVQLGATAGTVTDLGLDGVSQLAPQGGPGGGLGHLEDGHHGQGCQGEERQQPAEAVTPGGVLVGPVIV